MSYEDMREWLKQIERKLEEQGLDDAMILTIHDGIDTRQLVMKRKTLYDKLYPILVEWTQQEPSMWPEHSRVDNEALMCAMAWAQCRRKLPESVNMLFSEYNSRCGAPFLALVAENPQRPVSQMEDAIAEREMEQYLERAQQNAPEQEDECAEP